MKGDHFVLQRWEEDGLWHWELHKGYSPHGAIARSSQGYASRSAAKRSIASACKAFGGASHVKVGGDLYGGLNETLASIRIDERTSPRPKGNDMESQRVLRGKNRAWIDLEPVKAAFDRLVDATPAMSSCDGYFTQKKRSFVFKHRNTGKRPYSFIVTTSWLRFYFREPSIPGRARHEERLRKLFEERFCTDPNDLDEWTVNVTTEPEARFLVEEVLRPEFS